MASWISLLFSRSGPPPIPPRRPKPRLGRLGRPMAAEAGRAGASWFLVAGAGGRLSRCHDLSSVCRRCGLVRSALPPPPRSIRIRDDEHREEESQTHQEASVQRWDHCLWRVRICFSPVRSHCRPFVPRDKPPQLRAESTRLAAGLCTEGEVTPIRTV